MTSPGFENFKEKISWLSAKAAQSLGVADTLGLGAGRIPERLMVKPVDCWQGNCEIGQKLCSGIFTLGEEELFLQKHNWDSQTISQKWLIYMHSFKWLRDLRVLGTVSGQRLGAAYIDDWMTHNKDRKALSWRADVLGERLSMWICHYDCFCAGAEDDFLDRYFTSLAIQARFLSLNINKMPVGAGQLKAVKGLLYCGLALEHFEENVEIALDVLHACLQAQILSDGSHVSRSPAQLQSVLMDVLDIRMALMAGGVAPNEGLQDTIERMGLALRFFGGHDKTLAVFHGAQEGEKPVLDSVLAQSGVRGKIIKTLPDAGFERVSVGRSLLFFDGAKIPSPPYDRATHAGPLAFEFSYGKDRIFVNCGTHPVSEEWSDSLRSTAAHNTVTIDHRNACEIQKNGHFARKVVNPNFTRSDSKGCSLIEAEHDGYVPLNGVRHKRRIFLCEQGHDLRGEDVLDGGHALQNALDYAVRFHLHPRVLVSLIRDGQEALLRLPNGIGWRFHHDGGRLSLENSVYIGSGTRPRKTKQLVIYGKVDTEQSCVKWAVQREGL